jgi:RimJ/RimL family protein N-acetyltransferase
MLELSRKRSSVGGQLFRISNRSDVQLLVPDVERDSLFAFGWFSGPEGRATLLSMGNAEGEIEVSSLEGERTTIREFLRLENDGQQVTRMILCDGKTIGAVWIELFENHRVKPPSIHILIGDPDYRGKGIGSSVMQAAIEYSKNELHFPTIYSRHLVSNVVVTLLNESLGFVKDGKPYIDTNGLEWQGIKLEIS